MARKVIIRKRSGVRIPSTHPRAGNGKWQKIAKDLKVKQSIEIVGPRWMATNLMIAISKMYGHGSATSRRKMDGKAYEVWRIR